MQASATLSTSRRAPPRSSERLRPSAEKIRLRGPSVALDPRVHAVRGDIADIGIADRVFASHYARPEHCACAGAATMMLAAPDRSARAVSQLLPGERFAVVDRSADWAWGYSEHDHYVGYIEAAVLGAPAKPTHRVDAPLALVFSEANIKSTVRCAWSLGTPVTGAERGDFVETASGYVHRRHLRAATMPAPDPVEVAQRLLGLPYLWGGRGAGGIDCSGLVQLAFGHAGIPVPRDSDQQRAALGAELEAGAPLRRGDLIFFPGHVGMMVDDRSLLHANAHWMAVTVEPLGDVVSRVGEGSSILARRRPVA